MLTVRGPRLRMARFTVVLSCLLISSILIYALSHPSDPLGTSWNPPPGASRQIAIHRAQTDDGLALDPTLDPELAELELEDTQTSFEPAMSLTYDTDGLVKGWNEVHADAVKRARPGRVNAPMHPIYELIDRGQRRWDGLLRRQSKTLKEAVAAYRSKYGRAPPKGFDKWFEFTQANGVKIVDDYDQIEREISVWLGIAPAEFRRRVQKLEGKAMTYNITIRPHGESTATGDQWNSSRATDHLNLLRPLAPYLDSDVSIIVSQHDQGISAIADELRTTLREHAAAGTYISDDELKRLEAQKPGKLGILAPCHPESKAITELRAKGENATVGYGVPPIDDEKTSFIYDPAPKMDFCAAPELLTLHGVFRHHMMRGATLSPLFHQSKTAMTDEFLAIPLTAFDNMTSPQAMAKHSPWEEKKINKLFWRGSGTGEHFHEPDEVKRPGYDWRDSQRNRWHLFANAKEGVAKVWARATTPSRSGSGKGKGKAASVGWEHRTMPKAELNKRFFDAGLVGKPIQCAPAACAAMAEGIEYMPRINPQASHDYKYMFDTDGNGWSSRFHWLLASGSVVVKTTVFPEWMSDWLTPWVHYVPIQTDLSDLYDVMSFFLGADENDAGDDAAGQKIAEAGTRFAREHWRWEDMQAYMLRLLLEYARLGADDREAASYRG